MLLYFTVRRATAGSRRAAILAGKKAAAEGQGRDDGHVEYRPPQLDPEGHVAVLQDDEERAVEAEVVQGHPAHDDEGEHDAGEHAAYREEGRLEEEQAPDLVALHPDGAHRPDLPDALVHDDAESVEIPTMMIKKRMSKMTRLAEFRTLTI